MAKLAFSPAARQDLLEILDYIARDKPYAAVHWVSTIEDKCQMIATTPELGEKRPEYGSDIRCSSVGRYVIFYRVVLEGIEVARVIPGDRDIRML